jgi:hypothetical protein
MEKMPKSVVRESTGENLKEIFARIETKHPELKVPARKKLTTNEMLREAEKADYRHKKMLGNDY